MRDIGRILCVLAGLAAISCESTSTTSDDDDGSTGTDTWTSGDTDADGDADTDADGDTDTDADGDTDLDGGPDGGDDGGPSTDECVDLDSDWWCAGLDCNDSDPAINPGVPEVPGNGLDDDCDGETDELGCQESDCDDPCSSFMLGKSYIGCEYYPTVTLNSLIAELTAFDPNIFHFAVAVSNTKSDPANITVTMGTSTILTQQVLPDSVAVLFLPWTDLRTSASATVLVTDGAYHLKSDQPVTVYQFNPLEYCDPANLSNCSYTNDASLLLPVNTWGTSYAVASRNTWSGYSGFYAVVAKEDNTTLTLTPSATGSVILPGAGLASNSGNIVINEGDVLQVLSGAAATNDLTGSQVSSDKPIQVIGGHNCTDIPKSVTACDHLEESMFPISTLATEYIVSPPSLPTLAQPKAFRVRIIAIEGGTSLQYDPVNAAWPAGLANQGDYVEIDSAADFKITASKKVLVSQYMKGQSAGGNAGDPAMALAVASHQFRTSYLFHAPVNYTSNYVNIIAPDGASVTLDGTAVTTWATVGATGYSISRVKFPTTGDGNHHVEADAKVGITVYGYGSYTSYWYPGGLNLLDVW